MDNKERDDWLTQWTVESQQRGPRNYQITRKDGIDLPKFQETLDTGKASETYVADKLSGMGFTVQDISMEDYGEYMSPFDLLVSSQSSLFVAEVKKRNHRVPIGFSVNRMITYDKYNKYGAKGKLIIFHFPKSGHRGDCFFITTEEIRERCYIVGPFYHIELHMLTSLSALRKTLEDIYK